MWTVHEGVTGAAKIRTVGSTSSIKFKQSEHLTEVLDAATRIIRTL